MTSRALKAEFAQFDDLPPSLSVRDLYQIREETPSEVDRGYVNPNFSHSFNGLNDSFISLPSTGRLTPVYSQGSVSSLTSNCVIKRADGSTILVTPDRESRQLPSRPLKEKHIKLLKIFSIVGIFLFPPLGVAAFIYALLTEREFKFSQQTGDLTRAKQKAKICERLIIFSLVCGVLMYALIAVLIERSITETSPTENLGKPIL